MITYNGEHAAKIRCTLSAIKWKKQKCFEQDLNLANVIYFALKFLT
jgi:hypothetical protein